MAVFAVKDKRPETAVLTEDDRKLGKTDIIKMAKPNPLTDWMTEPSIQENRKTVVSPPDRPRDENI